MMNNIELVSVHYTVLVVLNFYNDSHFSPAPPRSRQVCCNAVKIKVEMTMFGRPLTCCGDNGVTQRGKHCAGLAVGCFNAVMLTGFIFE